MRTVILLVCLAYWLFLTALLLTPDPAALVGLQTAPRFPWGDIGIHFTAFTVLTVMVHATRWPRRPGWVVVALLVLYALATESIQAFIPPRTVELLDYTENLLGVAAGSGVYWLAGRVARWIHGGPRLAPGLDGKTAAADAPAE
jgi:VanZ family protein